MKFEVINLLGKVVATFDNESEAHDFADTLINYAYVEGVTE